MTVGESLKYFDCEFVRIVNIDKALILSKYSIKEDVKSLSVNSIDIGKNELILSVEPFKMQINPVFGG